MRFICSTHIPLLTDGRKQTSVFNKFVTFSNFGINFYCKLISMLTTLYWSLWIKEGLTQGPLDYLHHDSTKNSDINMKFAIWYNYRTQFDVEYGCQYIIFVQRLPMYDRITCRWNLVFYNLKLYSILYMHTK